MSKVKNVVVATGAGLTVAAGNAMAAVPTEVTTALSDAQTDGTKVAGLVLVVIIAIAAFKYIRKAL
ncbi:major capsid protein [Methylococcus mesophilus]|uniref:major capsid protein n=1 Tax=Methylococcus mesophilus TaxID=2993564 RepID=UPI00224AB576|nr:major capsid protein [Methylococcus mesophilus]UZR29440.1 major capsid protein [Methylococcus mesophilus]